MQTNKLSDSTKTVSLALAQLRRKLLNLTARNKFINFKHTIGKSLQFVECKPEHIYKNLVALCT